MSTNPDNSAQAAHYLNLAHAAISSGDQIRGGALLQVADVYKSGITPSTVMIQDGGTTVSYRAAAIRIEVGLADSIGDRWNFVLWQDPDGARFIAAGGYSDSVDFASTDPSLVHVGLIDWGEGSSRKRGVAGYARVTRGIPTGGCDPGDIVFACTREEFTISLSAILKPVDGATFVIDSLGVPHPLSGTALELHGYVQSLRRGTDAIRPGTPTPRAVNRTSFAERRSLTAPR